MISTILERFKSRFVMGEVGKCWEWPGEKIKRGYGTISVWNGKKRVARSLAHRVSWEAFHGEPPPASGVVCHSCDNPPCCNPEHLFVGTQADNLKDMWSKGRGHTANTGVGNMGSAKLQKSQVLSIRNSSEGDRDTALQFGVSRRTVRDIKSRRTWQCV